MIKWVPFFYLRYTYISIYIRAGNTSSSFFGAFVGMTRIMLKHELVCEPKSCMRRKSGLSGKLPLPTLAALISSFVFWLGRQGAFYACCMVSETANSSFQPCKAALLVVFSAFPSLQRMGLIHGTGARSTRGGLRGCNGSGLAWATTSCRTLEETLKKTWTKP